MCSAILRASGENDQQGLPQAGAHGREEPSAAQPSKVRQRAPVRRAEREAVLAHTAAG